MKAARLALLALACTLPLAAAAQWMWVDKDGRKVLSDRAPGPEVAPEKILRAPKGQRLIPAASTETAPAAPAAAAPALLVPKPSGKDKTLEERRKQAAAADAEKKKAEEQKLAQMREENCSRAKASKANFDSGLRIARTNAQGEREILDDDARARESKFLEGVIARDCAPRPQ